MGRKISREELEELLGTDTESNRRPPGDDGFLKMIAFLLAAALAISLGLAFQGGELKGSDGFMTNINRVLWGGGK